MQLCMQLMKANFCCRVRCFTHCNIGHPKSKWALVAFTSRTSQGGELHNPAIEKEATAIIEPIRKWFHLLPRKTAIMEPIRKWFHLLPRKTATLVTDQRSVAFTFDNRRNSKIKNNKVQSLEWNWHRTLTRLSKDQEKNSVRILFVEHFVPL